jgi:hypothetical protein
VNWSAGSYGIAYDLIGNGTEADGFVGYFIDRPR